MTPSRPRAWRALAASLVLSAPLAVLAQALPTASPEKVGLST